MKELVSLLLLFLVLGFCGCEETTGPSKDPEENSFYSRYRDIYNSYGKVPIDSTQKQLNNYLAEFPENADGWAFLGSICFMKEDYRSALTYYSKAVNLNRKKSSFYTGLGTTFNALNIIDSSEYYLLKALELEDSTAENYFRISLLYAKKGDSLRSIIYADSAFEKKNISAAELAGLSLVYLKAGKTKKSEELFEQSQKIGLKDTSGFRQVLNGSMKLEEYYRKNQY